MARVCKRNARAMHTHWSCHIAVIGMEVTRGSCSLQKYGWLLAAPVAVGPGPCPGQVGTLSRVDLGVCLGG